MDMHRDFIDLNDLRAQRQRENGHKKSDAAGSAFNVPIRTISARELRQKEFPPPRFVIPGYVPEGCTLLAGRPKLGKSWLVLDMGLAVATGGTCLGDIACEQGDVLYLALEDNQRRLQRRIDKVLGPVNEWPGSFRCANEWPRASEGGLDAMREWITDAQNPRLVIVDVLAMFRPASGTRDNMYEADYHAIKGLQALASEFGIAVIVVHHTRKSGSDVDPFEKVSGTLGLSGAADTTVVLDRDSNGATIYGRGRDIEEIESAVEFNKDNCRWFVMGKAEDVRRTDERSSILGVLVDADEPMNPHEISIATGANRKCVDQLLFKMAKAGQVRKVKRGLYVHPERPDLIKTQTSTPDKNGKKIRSGTGFRVEGGR
ncbi:AAA family ATPase [Microvirga zambiensis]|uniref:AAA family ATPase n=1 Tax=Microvirga zambiensis TaxID=1402137 RepID=UPI00191F7913|nr:AAA family ATPase [Microvirga zambiensis]